MTFDSRAYKTAWMRDHRAKQKRRELVTQGKCPISEILLSSKYHDPNCPCGMKLNYILVAETKITIEHTQNKDELQPT